MLDDGGPAFPQLFFGHSHSASGLVGHRIGDPHLPGQRTLPIETPVLVGGMRLRDFFAAATITGLYANSRTDDDWEILADDAYKQADAMIERRKYGKAVEMQRER